MGADSAFEKAAKDLKGKLFFITATWSEDPAQKHLIEMLGLKKSDLPAMYILTPNEFGATKYKYNGSPAAADEHQITHFAEEFINNKLTPFHKSAPIPKEGEKFGNDGTILEVVGKTWESQVRSGNKEVFIMMYRGDSTAPQNVNAMTAFHELCTHTKAVEDF
jgi:protein disulfide-isomerase A1